MADSTRNGGTDKGPPFAEDRIVKKRMNRRRIILRLVIAVLVIAGLAFGIPYYLHMIAYESTDDAFIEGHIIPISPRVPGHVNRVLVNDNQPVDKGDLLVEIDPDDFEARLNAAKAALEAAQAELQAARAGEAVAKSKYNEAVAQLAIAESTLAQAKTDVSSAKAVHERDLVDMKRAQRLARTNQIARQQLDHAVAAEKVSAARLAAARKNVNTREAMIREADAAVSSAADNRRQAAAKMEAAGADVDQAAAQVAQAELSLSYTKVNAPADGVVTKKSVESGAYVQVGQSLMALVTKDRWVIANYKETQMTHMKPGQPAIIHVDAYPDLTFHGHVDSIQHGTGSRFSLLPPENATGNYVKVVQRVPVKIVFDRSADIGKVLLAPGMSVVPGVKIVADGDGRTSAAQADAEAAASAGRTP